MFFPSNTSEYTGNTGVFDFDGIIFKDLWDDPNKTKGQFRSFVKYFISDHRPLWVEFEI